MHASLALSIDNPDFDFWDKQHNIEDTILLARYCCLSWEKLFLISFIFLTYLKMPLLEA